MNFFMHEQMTRAMAEERLAPARRRHSLRRGRNGRGGARLSDERDVPSRWGRLLRRRRVGDSPSTVTTTELGRIRLDGVLDRTAERIVESGTRTEIATLCAMSAAVGQLSPGAAAALVDWEGSEPARLRAFGTVHGVILRELGAEDRSRLLAQLTGTAQHRAQGVAAVEPACVTPEPRRAEGPVGESREDAA